ncbi:MULTISPECIES: cobalamin adenosyltransferase [unclassified Aliivibrio]|uniref:cobalamin adenosyltransferase n=1 Tax=unclassified Aliivibrio TaxID=2645654 RepID=UPI00080DF6A9|nr:MULTISPECIES: cobalamin adenosyltransferase [unclassified Aliivibrio]OCH17388.1 cobalamin adenosyltransferase [Aliivibrio sp. 1S165]OCH23554.1 cobalamin adenosyltransferase [Aliivibrio sp. 1S128]OCH34382.1 cobalamin adenosyltransferase [Aliivibrio sp. 1S175]
MALKASGVVGELSYPFIFEDSPLCDFEILTDELCAYTGLALSQITHVQVRGSLERLQPKIFHLNGSIRGKCGIFEEDVQELLAEMIAFKKQVEDKGKRFVLPRGTGPVIQLHQCRSLSKKVVRTLVQIDKLTTKKIPETLPRFANVLANYYFVLTRVLNQEAGIEEPEYVSINYPMPPKI